MRDIRVVLGDSDTLRRTLLRAQGVRRSVLVVAEAEDVPTMRAAVSEERPDVLLTTSVLGGVTTLGFVGDVASAVPTVVVAEDERAGLAAVSAGASGVLQLEAPPEDVLDAVSAVAGGGVVLDPQLAAIVVSEWRNLRSEGSIARPRVELTGREQEILAAMVEGLSTKAVARRLGIAVKTVENHKIRIFDKLGARTNAHAVSIALRLGLVSEPKDAAAEA